MIVEFCRWGNSLAVRIPKTVADALKVSNGKRAEIKVENGTLVLRPIVKPARKPRHTLDDLLSGMTKDDAPDYADYADYDDYGDSALITTGDDDTGDAGRLARCPRWPTGQLSALSP